MSPAFPDPARFPAVVSLYGDSFTFSTGVTDESAYGNVLSTLLKARVNNFGVPAYSTCQSYQYFKSNKADQARIVVLGVLAAHVARDLNQYYNLMSMSLPFGYMFRPRAVSMPQGGIRIAPPPAFSREQYEDCLSNPAEYLKEEYFLPGSADGLVPLRFPYTLSVVRAIRSNCFARRRRSMGRNESMWAEFYRPDHPSAAVHTTVSIITAFFRDAQQMGRQPVVAFFPEEEDMRYYVTRKRWQHQALFDELRAAGIPYFNVGDYILKLRDTDSIPRLFLEDGHFNAEGCRLQAEGVYHYLVERGIVPASK